MNASIGRFRESFLETHEDWIDDLQQMNEAPADWLTGYNGFRPHRSLNMTTPLTRFYNSSNGPFRLAAIQKLNRRYNMLENVMGYSPVLFGIVFIFFLTKCGVMLLVLLLL